MPRLLTLTALATALAWASPVRADDTYAWTMPPAEQQLAADDTVIPIGKGALFVPTITGAEYEPPATVVDSDEIVSVPLGHRYVIDPGSYTVVISSGTPSSGVGVTVEVVEGETTLVPVTWGALRIEVTDEHRIPHRGSYEILRADTREPISTGFGADTLQGEILQTWLLAPGLYRIVRTGQNYRTLTDFATVWVPEAGFVRYRIVMDEDTSEFLGAGVLLPDEFGSDDNRRFKQWFRSLVVGFDGAMVTSQNVVGAFNQTQYSANAFLDGQVSFAHDPHRFTLLAQIEEGASQIRPQTSDPLPVVKGTDRLRGDILHTVDLRGATGPYVRTSVESQAFPSDVLVTEDTTIRTLDGEGNTVSTADVAANETFHTADAWQPTIMREGVGINTRFLHKNRSTAFNLRLGFGMRQNMYEGALVLDDTERTPAIEYTSVDSFYEEGVEATVIASVRLPGWVVYSTDVEVFADFDTFGGGWERTDQGGVPVPPWAVSWRNTLALRITRNLSVNYYLNFDIEPQVIDKAQVEQSLLLRASWAIW